MKSGIFRGTASRRMMEKAKAKRRILRISRSDRSDALILSLVGSSGASFHITSQYDIFKSYVKSELGKVYLGDEPCNIVGKGDVMVSLSNGLTLELRNIKHVPNLKRNLISVGQLTDGGMKITFDGDVCKITKGAMPQW